MKLKTENPIDTLKSNKAFLKHPILREDINLFKANLQTLLGKINENEREEHHKTFVRDFLKDTFYKSDYEINTKGDLDLVIHVDKKASDKVGVIIETKKPSKTQEMITAENPNKKALHELVLYFLRERINEGNYDVKHLIVTNIYEWFIFDASVFNRLFYDNKAFAGEYKEWRDKLKITGNTPLFYNEIVKPYIETIDEEIPCTYFDIRDYKSALKNEDLKEDEKLIDLFKILSPYHLLKVQFADDSNRLDKNFYTELLHIIGLEEIKVKNKTIIQRKDESRRNAGSLLENAITILKTKDSLRKVKDIASYGETSEERYFNVALELCLTWINRVLFLKLLEAQLVNYHNSQDYRFLNYESIPEFDELFTLFHQVLARTTENREVGIKEKYRRIPYLNSSLFEPSKLEDQTITIESLKDAAQLSFINSTVFSDLKSKGKLLKTLEYLFKFLNAYDFASEGRGGIKENNRSLINASVLGKIFEKINGYKDGSIYTPGFITMYMCRQSIRLAVVQKFKDKFNIDIDTFEDLQVFVSKFHKTANIIEFNSVINSLKLCDPAVGSGHFLVSSLNEIIAIKSELGILADEKGLPLSKYEITVENDELTVFDTDRNEFFKYQITADGRPQSREAHRLQKTLFHEKQTIIENCLFGVDINPNSVKICSLRLWIELLKNAYYKESSNYSELETLPNIDINIKEGNSLISRFALDEDLSEILKQVQYNIEDYQNFVLGYKRTRDREKKREFENKIKQIKKDFRVELNHFSEDRIRLAKLENELFENTSKTFLFGEDENKRIKRLKRIEKLKSDISIQEQKIKEIEENVIYKNAFEWRFEFPEVLNNEGNFLGFDVVIGNPPYVFGGNEGISITHKQYFKQNFITGSGKINLFNLFIERSNQIGKPSGEFCFIIPNTFLRVTSYDESRRFLINNFEIHEIADFGDKVFEGIVTTAIVLIASFNRTPQNNEIFVSNGFSIMNTISQNSIENNNYVISLNINPEKENLIHKIKENSIQLGSICKELIFGVVITKNKGLVVSDFQKDGWKPFLEGNEIEPYFIKPIKQFLNYKPELLHRARTKEVFEVQEKLLIQRITGGNHPVKVAYDNQQLYNKESINNLILKPDCNFYIKFILCILNSKLINWFYTVQFTNQSNLTVNLSKEYLSQIPIKEIASGEQKPFINLVDEILEKKKLGQDTTDLEDKIDCLVYRLYDLTVEEIAIVEGNYEKEIKCEEYY